MSRLSFKSLFIIIVFLLIPIVFLFRLNQQPKPATAGWFNDNWLYRQAINISSHTAGETNVYIIASINIGTTTKAQADNGDFRFTTATGQLLPYYLSSGVGSTLITVHISLITFPAGAQTFYAYYGNPSATNGFNSTGFSTQASNYTIGSYGAQETGGGPIAYWKFDEGVNVTANDSGSIKANATLSGSKIPSWASDDQCISGKCISQDATTFQSTVTNTDITKGWALNNDFTLSLWFNCKGEGISVGSTQYNYLAGLFIHGTSSEGGSGGFYLRQNSSVCTNVQFNVGASGASNSIQGNLLSPTSNTWHYLVAIKNGDNLSLYDNGTQIKTQTFAGANWYVAINQETRIGSVHGRSIKGLIDEVKVYPYARTQAQINQDYNAGKAHASSNKGIAVNLGSNVKNSEAFSDGLVGYWKMDEGVGTTTLDSSGNSNTATFATGDSAPSWGNGKYGVGISFNGTTQYATSNIGGTNLTELTYSFYFNIGNTAAYSGILQWATALSSGSPAIYVRRNGSSIDLYNSGAYSTSITVTPNVWHHFTATYKNSVTSIFIDGTLGTTFNRQLTSTYLNNAVTLYLGNGFNGFFDGLLDEVRLYNRALSPAEVNQLYDWAPGPVGHWKFDEGVGTTAFDSSGNNYHSDIMGTVGNQWSAGKYGGGINFNGNNNYMKTVNFPASTTSVGSAGSAQAWFHISSVPASKGFISFNGNKPLLYFGSDGFQSYNADANSYSSNIAGSNIPLNQWNHVAWTWSNNTHTMYLNGVKKASGAWNTTFNRTAGPIYFGSYSGGGNNYTGRIDDVRIYNYTRTQKQVIEDMNAGHPFGGSPVGSQVLYWKFDEGFGTATADWGPQKNNGTLTCSGTGCTLPTWTNNGKFGKALYFSGVGNTTRSYVRRASINVASTIGEKITISLWVNPDINQLGVSSAYLIRNGDGTDQNYGINLSSPSSNIYKINFSGYFDTFRSYTTSGYYIPSNQWSQITVIFSQGEWVKFYVNGQYKETSSLTYGTTAQSTSYFNVGGHSGSTGQYLNGYIDEVKIYNAALTASEIALDYNQGKALVMGSLSSGGTGNTAPSTASSQEYCVPGDPTSCAPPMTEWKFDEGVGSSIYDSSGNNYHTPLATGDSAPTWTSGKTGKGLNFDGINDYIPVTINVPETEYTYQSWFKTTDTAGAIITSVNPVGPTAGYHDRQFGISSSGKFCHRVWSEETYCSTNSVNDNKWHFAVVTVGSQGGKLYIDGVQVAVGAKTGSDASGQTGIVIGYHNYGGWGAFQGVLDQVRIYNYARTPAQIAWDYNRGKPIGHWKMDDCQGTQVADWSGFANHGTLSIGASGSQNIIGTCSVGTSAAWTAGASGKFNSSLNFDGNDDYVYANGVPGSNGKELSLTAWFKTTTTSNQTFLGYGGVNDWINLKVNSTFQIWDDINDSNTTISGITQLQTGNWYFATFTLDSSGIKKIYLNSQLEVSSNTTSTVASDIGTTTINIGRRNYSTAPEHFSGQIDDVRVYNYALTSEQVKQVYNNNSSVNYAPITGSP